MMKTRLAPALAAVITAAALAACDATTSSSTTTTPSPPPPPVSPPPPPTSPPPPTASSGPQPVGPYADFRYYAPGDLRTPTEPGLADRTLYLPETISPPYDLPFYPNSQVNNPGGSVYGSGGQCDAHNYTEIRDTLCETSAGRHDNPMDLCPTGFGHEGIDVRGSTCAGDTNAVYAMEGGVVSRRTDFTNIEITGDSGTWYRYLHLFPMVVNEGDYVAQGELLGYASDWINYVADNTTWHVHIEAKQYLPVGPNGDTIEVRVPLYPSVINAIRQDLGLPTQPGTLIEDAQHEYP